MEVGGMFFDVGLDGHEILMDKRRSCVVRVGFGFQPNASNSVGGRAEVNQQRFVVRFRLGERCINVFVPFNSHLLIPPLQNYLYGSLMANFPTTPK